MRDIGFKDDTVNKVLILNLQYNEFLKLAENLQQVDDLLESGRIQQPPVINQPPPPIPNIQNDNNNENPGVTCAPNYLESLSLINNLKTNNILSEPDFQMVKNVLDNYNLLYEISRIHFNQLSQVMGINNINQLSPQINRITPTESDKTDKKEQEKTYLFKEGDNSNSEKNNSKPVAFHTVVQLNPKASIILY